MDGSTKIWKFTNVKVESVDSQKKRLRIFLNFMCLSVHLCDSECLLYVHDVVCVCA